MKKKLTKTEILKKHQEQRRIEAMYADMAAKLPQPFRGLYRKRRKLIVTDLEVENHKGKKGLLAIEINTLDNSIPCKTCGKELRRQGSAYGNKCARKFIKQTV